MVRQANTDFGTGFDLYPDVYLAFNEAVISETPFEAVIHTASPYYLHATDIKKEFLDPGSLALSCLSGIRDQV